MNVKQLQVQDLCDLLEKVAPLSKADEWDNVGLLCGRRNASVSKILLCVDVTTEVIEEAIQLGCQLIVAHHPFLMYKTNRIDAQDFKSDQILTLAEHKIAVISAHTNADSVEGGMNDYLAKLLGLTDVVVTDHSRYLRVGSLPTYLRVGSLPTQTVVGSFANIVKQKLVLKTAIVCGDLEKRVKRVGVYTGGVSVPELIKAKELFDVVVTGEFNYHKALDLKEEGVTAILCGHFSSELLFTWWFKEILEREMPGLEVCISERQKEPFVYL